VPWQMVWGNHHLLPRAEDVRAAASLAGLRICVLPRDEPGRRAAGAGPAGIIHGAPDAL